MRRLIAVALVVTAVAALLPGVMGLYLHHRYTQLLEDVVAQGYRVHAASYRQRWARSAASFRIAPPDGADDAQAQVRVALDLKHGYGVWAEHWPPSLATVTGRASVLGGPRPLPPLVLTATLGLAGGIDGTLRVPDVTYSGAVGQLHFVDGKSAFAYAPGGHWTLSGKLGALEATEPDSRKLRLGGLGWELALGALDAALPTARLAVTLSQLGLDGTEGRPPVALSGLQAALDIGVADAAARLVLTGGVDSLTLGADAYAPSHIGLRLEGLSAPALRALRVRFAALDATALTASQRGAAVARLVLDALPALLAGEVRLELETLRLATPFGELRAQADLALVPAGDQPVLDASTADGLLRTLGARLVGTAEVSAPQALVVALITQEQTERMQRELALRGEAIATLPPELAADVAAAAQASTRALLRERWLVAEQGRLVARLQLGDGRLSVNDKAVAAPDWLAPPTLPARENGARNTLPRAR
jgi:hypothetical protein